MSCVSHQQGRCVGCSNGISRRAFVKGCGAVVAASSGLAAAAEGLPDKKRDRVRIGLVFLSKAGASWPHPGFDVVAREKEITQQLSKGCPGIEFVSLSVRSPADIQKALALKDDVDGYLVYVVTLEWRLQRGISEIGKLGKPLVVADEYLGGSGTFLIGYSRLCARKVPAVGVASRRLDDLVTVARCFRILSKPGATPESFADHAGRVYRKTFATIDEMECREDAVDLKDIGECVEEFKKSQFLIVGRGHAGNEHDFIGAKGIYAGFDELKALYEKVDTDEAARWAGRWSESADRLVDVNADWVRKAAAIYLATVELLKRHKTDTVTMNCLGGFGSGRLPAYPCLGFMQLLNDGGHGVCEAMPDDTLSMLMARILTGRPGFVSDPVLDTSKKQIVYAHCMATTKVFGPNGKANKFRIRRLHDNDPRSTCVQSFLPAEYMTTSFRTNFARKQMVIHRAKSVGNADLNRGCRTQLVGEVCGDIGRLFDHWSSFGWHRVTVYGDVKEPLMAFGKALGLTVVEEA